METSPQSPDMPRPSFAKVAAASTSKDKAPPINTVRRVNASGQERSEPHKAATAPPVAVTPQIPPIANGSNKTAPTPAAVPAEAHKPDGIDHIVDGLRELRAGAKTPSLVVNGSASSFNDRVKMLNRDGSDDSQRADSNSELGTKPPSLDGKSITSGTTFALDEKESLRPDDSASVKAAAAEDDDAFSFRGPLLPNSRMGSDLAARARGIQLGDMPERRPLLVTSGSQSQGAATPQSASSDQQNASSKANMAKITDLSNYMNALHGQTPDEKLLEAMSSQKDRFFVLRLEAELIKFVTKSKEPFMDFPPSNSFCRMLTHKLADYYHMTHQFEPRIQSVRIFRTPYARVPESLANLGIPEPKNETPPPAVLPRKIMRRGEEGGTLSGSGSPSKPTSEVGNDGKEKGATSNQKMTREEREEAYNKARERIFGSSEKTGESTPDPEGENGVSRASSVSAKEKANANKRGKNKQRRDDSDSLDSRHLYGPFGPQQSWAQQPQFGPVAGNQYPMGMQQPYNGQMQPMYPPQPAPAYPPHMYPAAYPQYQPGAQGYQAPHVQHQPPPGPGQPLPPRPQMGGPHGTMYGSPVPTAPQPAWQQGYNPNVPAGAGPGSSPGGGAPYVPRGVSAPPPAPTVPYAYGQLPAHLNPNDPKSQHPIPGSYNRHAFNPKTQSFVPGGALGPMQQPQPSFSAPGSHHGSPQIPSPHLAYNGYAPTGPAAGYGAPGAYGMARQGSSNSVPPYHPPAGAHHPGVQQVPPPAPGYIPNQVPQSLPPNPPPHIPNKPAPPQGPPGQFGHLPQYGNPATLPQKPNTGH